MIDAPRLLGALACALLLAPASGTQQASEGGVAVSVLLHDDSQYTGDATVAETGELRLEVDPYDVPATLDLDLVTSLVLLPGDRRWPLVPERGRDQVTLARRQNLRGRVGALRGGVLEFESTRFGAFQLPLEACGDLLPPALADTDGPARPLWGPWIEGGAQAGPVSEAGLLLGGRGALAARRCMDYGDRLLLDLAWEGEPAFRVHLGGDPAADPPEGVVVEPWDGALVVYSLTGGQLDLQESGVRLEGDSGAILRFDLAGDSVRLTSVELRDGRIVTTDARVARPDRSDTVSIRVLEGRHWLRRAQVSSTVSVGPGEVVVDRPVRVTDVEALDPRARSFQVAAGAIDLERSQGIRFAAGEGRSALDAPEPEAGWYRVTCRDGEAIEARDLELVPGGLRLRPRWADAAVTLPLTDLWHLRQRAPVGNPLGTQASLELEGRATVNVRLAGFEVGGEAPRPVLQVFGFEEPIAIPEDESFSIVRRDASSLPQRARFPSVLVLADGQRLPVLVSGADAAELRFRTPLADGELRIPQERVRAVLLAPKVVVDRALALSTHPFYADGSTAGRSMDLALRPQRALRDGDALRLSWALSVPRSQRDSPGEQLFIARNGDLLRADLVRLEGGVLRLEGGASPGAEVPIQRLAGWVRVDRAPELDVTLGQGEWQLTLGVQETVAGSTPGAAVLHGTAVGFADGALSLEHADLGTLRIDLGRVRRVDHADRARRALLPFDLWRTRPMVEPDSGEGLGGR